MMLWQRQSILVGLRTSIICYLRPIPGHILYLYALTLGIKNLRPLVEGAAACHLVVIFNIHLDLELLLHNLVDSSPCVDLALFQFDFVHVRVVTVQSSFKLQVFLR